MGSVEEHRAKLRQLDDWLPYLAQHSGLPGPRANLELVAACGEEADRATADELVATGDEFATMCGLVALARLLGDGDPDPVGTLHEFAGDARWRVREGVAMALQRACDDDPISGFDQAEKWSSDPDPLVRRAVVAAICEPRLLRDKEFALRALRMLDKITADLVRTPAADRRDSGVRTLRRALGYGWSVVIAATPTEGLAAFRRLEADPDPDIGWIVRENRKKTRLKKVLAVAGDH